MAEANLRSIRPWRQYLPTPAFFAFQWRMKQLNSYIKRLLRERWNSRHKRSSSCKRDILDRLITAIEVLISPPHLDCQDVSHCCNRINVPHHDFFYLLYVQCLAFQVLNGRHDHATQSKRCSWHEPTVLEYWSHFKCLHHLIAVYHVHRSELILQSCCVQAKGGTWSAALETQLCYEIKTFLLAGHETSAAMLTWTLYELTQRADSLSKVRKGSRLTIFFVQSRTFKYVCQKYRASQSIKLVQKCTLQ